LFTFERSREPCPTVLLVYVRAFLTPCLCSSGVENPALLYSLFMFERSREPCLCSSGVENLVYVRAFLTPCLCSSEAENPALLVYVRAESRTFFVRQAESRTLRSLFMFERSREPCATFLHVYVRAFLFIKTTYHTMFMFERSREPCATCSCSSGVENPALLVYVRAESRTLPYLTPCLCSNLYNSMFTFERSREPFSSGRRSREPYPTLLLVYVRALLTPCLCSSGVENPLSNSNITNYFLFE